MPDFGMAMLKIGLQQEAQHHFVDHHIQSLMKVSDDLYVASTSTAVGDIEYIVSLDMSKALLDEVLKGLPQDVSAGIAATMSRAPFAANLAGKVLLSCAGQLGNPT